MVNNLFGDDFDIQIKQPTVKDLTKKVNDKKEVKVKTAEQVLKSKKLTIHDKLEIISTNVTKTLGKQKSNIIVIRDNDTFEDYITKAIASGRIAVDTETNNSLDPVTCKLMGPCLYYPGGKQAYIPLNHRNPDTKERLSWQLTEEDCRKQFQRINDSKIDIIMHNGKFDYEVIKCTCGIEVIPTWDTMVCARLLNENEAAGLKWQYVNKIDKTQEKYDIEGLFENVAYADVEPEIFALYAATDSMMTDKLYLLQKEELDKPEYGPHMDLLGTHEIKGLRWLFHEVEMPIVVVTAEMELRGVKIDTEFGARLKEKYDTQLTLIDKQIEIELQALKPSIEQWKNKQRDAEDKAEDEAKETQTGNKLLRVYAPAKSKMAPEKLAQTYPYIDESGLRYKMGKSKTVQLEDPVNLASPTQLAILFYDVLNVETEGKKSRGTGEEELKAIAEKYPDLKICSLILARRGIVKLITTYIDVIPELAKHWPDGRIRFHLNSLGTDTGRYSSGGKIKYLENDEPIEVSGINIQNIPSHNPEIRMLFQAEPGYRIVGSDYSAQEPRMTTFLSGDKTMYNAYLTGKDLYAMIAQSAFDNNYEDNLEFFVPGTTVEVDGNKVVSGSGKEFEAKTDEEDSITVKYYEILETPSGDTSAENLQVGDKIVSDIGQLSISKKVQINNEIKFTFTL